MLKSRTGALLVALMTLVLLAGLVAAVAGCGEEEAAEETGMSESSVDLMVASGKLWDDFAFWGREVVLAAVNGSPNIEAAVARWNKSADDLGAVVGTYYGAENGTTATEALKKLQADAIALVTAAKAGDTAGQAAANEALAADADAIAKFLDGANPTYWPYDTVLAVLKNILQYTTDYAVAALGGQWQDSVTAFDKTRDEILVLSDTFATGVIEQFPEKF